jgi:uncharacterized membrane protein
MLERSTTTLPESTKTSWLDTLPTLSGWFHFHHVDQSRFLPPSSALKRTAENVSGSVEQVLAAAA